MSNVCAYDYNDLNLRNECRYSNTEGINNLCWNEVIRLNAGACPGPSEIVPPMIQGPLASNYGAPSMDVGATCMTLYNGSYPSQQALKAHFNPNRTSDDKIYGDNSNGINFVPFDSGVPDPQQIGSNYFFSTIPNINSCSNDLLDISFIIRDSNGKPIATIPPSSNPPLGVVDKTFFPTLEAEALDQAPCNAYNQTCIISYDKIFYTKDDVKAGYVSSEEALAYNQTNAKNLYNLNFIRNPQDPAGYEGTNIVNIKDLVMAHYCPQDSVSTNCPTINGQATTSCTNFSADPTCKQWVQTIQTMFSTTPNANPGLSDLYNSSISRACLGKDQNYLECQCENRGNVKAWQDITKLLPVSSQGSEQCWYIPCSGNVPGILTTTDEMYKGNCPKYNCEQLLIIKNSGEININEFNASINCNNQPSPPGPHGPNNFFAHLWEKYKWWIIGIAVVLVVVIIIVIIILLFK